MKNHPMKVFATKNIAIFARWVGAAGIFIVISGCATGPHPRDPFEPFNRGVSQFNDDVDRAVLRPVATAYQNITPAPVRTGVRNFFVNFTEPWSFVNNVAQFKFVEAADTLMRLSINTVFGLGGISDVASQANIDRHRQDFGQTLATYGVGTGPYLVLPLLGPSTVRDTVSLPLVWNLDVLSQVDNIASRNVLTALRVVDTRASLLRAGAVLDQAALDPYTFQRDVFLQLRDNQGARGGDEGLDDGGGVLPELPDAGKP